MVAAPKPNAHPSRRARFATKETMRVTAAITPVAIVSHSSGAPRSAAITMVQITVLAAKITVGMNARFARVCASALT